MSRVVEALRPCIGCGALVPESGGPMHPYIGASPGCWAIYGEILAKEYGEYHYPPVHHLTVDAYAAQHPGEPSRRSVQSVAVHLISLHLVLERGYGPKEAAAGLRKALSARRQNFVWLDPPGSPGAVTVLDVWEAKNLTEHTKRVERWAGSVWESWKLHHPIVREWARPGQAPEGKHHSTSKRCRIPAVTF